MIAERPHEPVHPSPQNRTRRFSVAQWMVFANGLILTLAAYFILGALIRDILVQDRQLMQRAATGTVEEGLRGLEQTIDLTAALVLEKPSFPSGNSRITYEALRVIEAHTTAQGLSFSLFRLKPGPQERWTLEAVRHTQDTSARAEDLNDPLVQMARQVGETARQAPVFISEGHRFALVRTLGKAEGYVLGIGDMDVWRRAALGHSGLSMADMSVDPDALRAPLLMDVGSFAQKSGEAQMTYARPVRVGLSTLRVTLDVRSSPQAAFLEQIPILILIFGLTLTFIGTLYVSSTRNQSAHLMTMNTVLSRKNQELNAEVAHREKLNETIRQAERENRAIIDSVSDVIFETETDGTLVFLNEAWSRVTGFEPNRSMGWSLFDLIHPQDQEEQRAAFRDLLRGHRQSGTRSFARIRTADGTFRTVELALAIMQKGENERMLVLGTMTDVEARRRAERALIEAEKKYRAIVENAAGGLYQLTPEGLYLSANPALARILGHATPEDVLRGVRNANREIYVDPHGRAAFVRLLSADEATHTTESEIMRADRAKIWVREHARAVRDETGQILYFEGSMEDVTERKKAEEALREAKLHSDIASRAKSEFLANMSHELRTPLNHIIGFSEILKNEVFGPLGQQVYWEYVNEIHEGGKRLLSVINQILDVSRIEAGDRPLNEGIVDVGKLVAECVSLLDARARAALVTVSATLDESLPRLIGEDVAIRQSLTNLLSNAIKFTPPGGRVSVSCALDASGQLRLCVEDTGMGMDDAEIARALAPFGVGTNTGAGSRAVAGAGLGLTLAVSLMRLHGGRVDIVSRKGKGTAATLVFPARRVAARDHGARKAGSVSDATKAAVLRVAPGTSRDRLKADRPPDSAPHGRDPSS